MASKHAQQQQVEIILFGDSDIAQWPKSLHPTLPNTILTVHQSGHSGATLHTLWRPLNELLQSQILFPHASAATQIFIVCAGENDIGAGTTILESQEHCENLLATILNPTERRRVVFLGPKFEPWLSTHLQSRKQYVWLSKALSRVCETKFSGRAHFVDCLGAFCGDSASVPGATLGGRALPEPHFFQRDQLHLSEAGYRLWKSIVEREISKIIQNN